eukprot:TRINITY_DN1435_c1_g1_i9.p1 TRINITY_DN1435_c1_g1~~TRINITY_DN1435_c1_g1_i9.p1  ORF type:complete len:286 (+),score=44.84 TRINITY_DN1435_c1_g1_i9:83-940(+)
MQTPAEYLTEVYRIIKENFRPSDPSGGMLVAPLAMIVHRAIGIKQKGFGFGKFKDVLAVLEASGLLRTGLNDANLLSVWLPENNEPQTLKPIDDAADSVRSLRSHAWLAFVSSSHHGEKFLNRLTGEIRTGDGPPTGNGWVRIPSVPRESQRELAREFVRRHPGNDDLLPLIEEVKWYFGFTNALRAKSPDLVYLWNRTLSRYITSIAAKWCHDNQIRDSLIFDEEHEWREPSPTTPLDMTSTERQAVLKELVLRAIADMPLQELLQVAIPAHRLIAVLRPELMD